MEEDKTKLCPRCQENPCVRPMEPILSRKRFEEIAGCVNCRRESKSKIIAYTEMGEILNFCNMACFSSYFQAFLKDRGRIKVTLGYWRK
jgi:hypothetical protein